MKARWLAAAAAALAGALLLSSCSPPTLADLPLPGGQGSGGPVYHVTVEFRDVMDLVPKAAVKVNDVTVGSVDKIEIHGWSAQVLLSLSRSVHLPANAVAKLRQTSLLGEKYVSLEAPTDEAPTGRLADGAVIPLARSGRNAEVEEVFGALSLLLNGGGVAQLKTINVELSRAMSGRQSDLRAFLRDLDTFVATMDKHKGDIQRAIDGIDRLSAQLAAQKQTIGAAIDELPSAVKVLADQRAQLTSMLTHLAALGTVSTRIITASKDDTVASLRSLSPVLGKLAEAGQALPNALQVLLTYPFPDAAMNAITGDFTNLDVTADLNLGTTLGNLAGNKLAPVGQGARNLAQTLDGKLKLVCDTARTQKVPLADAICNALPQNPTQQTLASVCKVLYPTGLIITGLQTLCQPPSNSAAPAPQPQPVPTLPAPSPTTGEVCLPGLLCIPGSQLNLLSGSSAPSSDPTAGLNKLLMQGVG